MKLLLRALFLFSSFSAQAQQSYMFSLGAENFKEQSGFFHSMPTGDVLVTHQSAVSGSTPDSILVGLTLLNSSLSPQWNKVYTVRANSFFSDPTVLSDGGINGIFTNYETQSRFYNYLVNLSPTGEVLKSLEFIDSTNGLSGYLTKRISFENHDLLFSSRSTVLYVDANDQILSARKPSFNGDALLFNHIQRIPGTNGWVGIGQVEGANLGFFIKGIDTTITQFHIYTVNEFRQISLLPGGDFIVSATEGADLLHLMRLDANGGIVWIKSHSLPKLGLNRLLVDSDQGIWLTGTTSPLVSGVIAHFSPTGEYRNRKCMFKLQRGLGRMYGMLYRENSPLLVAQDYNHSSTLNGDMLIHSVDKSDLDFLCYQYPINELRDTTISYVDSIPTLPITWEDQRWGVSSTLSKPIVVQQLTAQRIEATCPQSLLEFDQEEFKLIPNPTLDFIRVNGVESGEPLYIYGLDGRIVFSGNYTGSIDLSHVPQGVYLLSIPEKGVHRKLIRE